MIQNLFGFMPPAAMYGFVANLTGSQRWAMGMLMYSSILSIGLLAYGIKAKLHADLLNEERKNSLLP